MEISAIATCGLQTFAHSLGLNPPRQDVCSTSRAISSKTVRCSIKIRSSRCCREIMQCSSGSRVGDPRTRAGSIVKELGNSLWGQALVTIYPVNGSVCIRKDREFFSTRVQARELATRNAKKLNLDQYVVTLDSPTGIRFAQLSSGKIFVDALAKNGNAEKARIMMVGDVLKKTSGESGDALLDVEDLGQAIRAIKACKGPVSLVFERSSSEFRSSVSSSFGTRNVKGASKRLSHDDDETFEPTGSYADQEGDDIEWTHGNFNKDEYSRALERAESDLSYNPALGIKYTAITEQIYVGSCIQGEDDLQRLVDRLGITAVLNLQRGSEQENWGIDGAAIEQLADEKGLVFVNCPIRDVDAVDLRRKLPFAVGVLYRLLRKGCRVYVTCTTGLDRSPACVIAYLHWIQDVALEEALEYIQKLHPCGPDIPALVWATWDLIALAENGDHKGPPTHAVQFVWNHGCRDGEEVLLVGEFKGGWNEPIKAVHASGPKYTVDLRLPQGKYKYKFIVGGHWRHSSSLPTEGDEWGNINNVLKIGDVATIKFDTPHRAHFKELNSIKVIERPLTEDERFTLAFAARRMAFAIDPFSYTSKK